MLKAAASPFEDYFKLLEKKQIGGCCFLIDDNKCNKNCQVIQGDLTYCNVHAKKKYSTIENNMKVTKIKKANMQIE